MCLFISKLRTILAASILATTLATPAQAWYSYSPSWGAAMNAGLAMLAAENPSQYAGVYTRRSDGRWIYSWSVSGWWGSASGIIDLTAYTCSRFLFRDLTPTLNDRIREAAMERVMSETYVREGLRDECLEGDIPVDYTGPLPSPQGQGIAYISEYSKSRELDLAASLLPRSIAEFSPRLRFVTEDGHFAFSMQRFGLTMEHKFVGDSGITSLQFNRKFGKNKQHIFQLNGELDRSHTDLNLSDYGLGTLYLDPQYSVNARVQFRW